MDGVPTANKIMPLALFYKLYTFVAVKFTTKFVDHTNDLATTPTR